QALESEASAASRGLNHGTPAAREKMTPPFGVGPESLRAPIAGLCAVAEARDGIFQYRPERSRSERSIAWYGEYLQPELDVLARLITPGATVLEVGARIGAHTIILASKAGDAGHVLVGEPLYELRSIPQNSLRA